VILIHVGVIPLLLITQATPVAMLLISLEGKLLGAWVDEARQVIAAASARDCVCLNLQRLMFADLRGIELLRTLRHEGIPLINCSPLVEGLLASGAPTGATVGFIDHSA
jgi:hypothetical protein